MAKADLTQDYENGAFIENAAAYPDKWADAALAWRETENAVGRARLNLAYGQNERHKIDLFLPAGRPRGLMVFVHGGYWMKFDRKLWSHLAAGPCGAGWAVAMPSYTLAPQARISQITQEIAQSITFAATKVAGPIVLAGHSAGGHLVARMNCADVALDIGVAARIRAIAPISPLCDLRPLMQTQMNATLGLDAAEAQLESPALAKGLRDIPTHIWVGAEERPAFLDQARWLVESWPQTRCHIAPGRHHFDIIDMLLDPDSQVMRQLLQN